MLIDANGHVNISTHGHLGGHGMRQTLSVLITVMVMLVSVTGSAAAFTVADTHVSQAEQPTTVTNETTTTTPTTTDASNETTQSGASLAPGVLLAGSINVQQAELHGVIEYRAFGVRIANATSTAVRASVLNHTQEHLQQRLNRIEERKEALNASLAAGEITQAQYAVAMSTLSTRAATIRQLANRSTTAARDMPVDVLRSHGVNVTALEQLRTHARNMTGQEVSALARRIGAGHGIGASGHAGPPERIPRGPPVNRTNGNETGPNGTDRMGPHAGNDDTRRHGPPAHSDTTQPRTTTENTTTTSTATTTQKPQTTQSPPTTVTTGR